MNQHLSWFCTIFTGRVKSNCVGGQKTLSLVKTGANEFSAGSRGRVLLPTKKDWGGYWRQMLSRQGEHRRGWRAQIAEGERPVSRENSERLGETLLE
jgi:hypothetical protein